MVKNLPAMRETWVRSLGLEDPLPGEGNGCPLPVFWPGEFHGLYSPWGCKESDTTERLSLSVIKNPPANAGDVSLIPGSGRSPGGGNGTPLHYSCLGNPMGRGAWRAPYRPQGVRHNWWLSTGRGSVHEISSWFHTSRWALQSVHDALLLWTSRRLGSEIHAQMPLLIQRHSDILFPAGVQDVTCAVRYQEHILLYCKVSYVLNDPIIDFWRMELSYWTNNTTYI